MTKQTTLKTKTTPKKSLKKPTASAKGKPVAKPKSVAKPASKKPKVVRKTASHKKSDLIKSKERVDKFGEVFTPDWVVSDMLNAIDPNDMANPEHIFFEPSSGNGQFLVGIIRKRMECGIDLITALNTMVGIELQMDNVIESKNRLIELCRGLVFKAGKRKKFSEWNEFAKCVLIIETNIICADSLVYMKQRKILEHVFVINPIQDSDAKFLSEEERQEKVCAVLDSIHK